MWMNVSKQSPNAKRVRGATALLGAILLLGAPRLSLAQSVPGLPFFVGERLTFGIRVDKFGTSGRGVFSVEGPTEVRGTSTLLLRSDIQVGVGPIKASDRSESWLDTQRMTTLRYTKHERHFLARKDERVDMFPGERRWETSHGDHGTSLTDAPLDELSFIYFVRTLPLDGDSAFSVNRHYDALRNPVALRVLGRETIRTPAGEFQTIVVEMRVRDPARYGGEGVIRFFLSDDRFRLPVRIESTIPRVGQAVFLLESYTRPAERVANGGK
jgi:hypothetical protein